MHQWALNELGRVFPNPDNLTRQTVTALLSVWSRMTVFAGSKLDVDDALDVFASLARGQQLHFGDATPSADASPRVWAPAATYANLSNLGRVRPDFDDGPDGWKVNGRVGDVVSVRRGDLILSFHEHMDGAPDEFRSHVKDFEVDISHLGGAQ